MRRDIIYVVLHNPMYMESAAQTVSMHWTLEGAYKAFRKLIVDAYNEERERYLMYGYPPRRGEKYNGYEWFGIRKRKIED